MNDWSGSVWKLPLIPQDSSSHGKKPPISGESFNPYYILQWTTCLIIFSTSFNWHHIPHLGCSFETLRPRWKVAPQLENFRIPWTRRDVPGDDRPRGGRRVAESFQVVDERGASPKNQEVDNKKWIVLWWFLKMGRSPTRMSLVKCLVYINGLMRLLPF